MSKIIITSPEELATIVSQELRKVFAEINSTQSPHAPNSEEPIGVKEAMELLKMKASTIYQRTSKGTIPCHKAENGKQLYFYKSELLKWIQDGKMASQADIEAQADAYIASTYKKQRNNSKKK